MDLIRALDWGILRELTEFTQSSLTMAIIISVMAELLIIIPFVTLFALWRMPEPVSHHHGNQKAALLAILTVFLALALNSLIEFLIFRDRPFVSHPELYHLPLKVDPASFPSGHTLLAFSVAFSLWMSGLRKAGGWLLFIACCIGFGRIAAGVHYPTDVAGGIVVALLASWYLHREASSIKKFLPNN